MGALILFLSSILLTASAPALALQSASTPIAPSGVAVRRTSDISKMPDSEPVPIYQTEPKYTDEAKQHNVSGSVILRADIGIDGTLHNVAVVIEPDIAHRAQNTLK